MGYKEREGKLFDVNLWRRLVIMPLILLIVS